MPTPMASILHVLQTLLTEKASTSSQRYHRWLWCRSSFFWFGEVERSCQTPFSVSKWREKVLPRLAQMGHLFRQHAHMPSPFADTTFSFLYFNTVYHFEYVHIIIVYSGICMYATSSTTVTVALINGAVYCSSSYLFDWLASLYRGIMRIHCAWLLVRGDRLGSV